MKRRVVEGIRKIRFDSTLLVVSEERMGKKRFYGDCVARDQAAIDERTFGRWVRKNPNCQILIVSVSKQAAAECDSTKTPLFIVCNKLNQEVTTQ